MARCYYRTLGLSTRATVEEIRRSFRLLALRFHPDRNPRDPDAVERFRQAVEAYETLVDPNRRKQYDRRRGLKKSKPPGAGTGPVDEGNGPNARPMCDIVEEYFGVRASRSAAFGGTPDLRFDLQVARSTLGSGTVHQVEYVREAYCGTCFGRGVTNGKSPCPGCDGSGRTEEPMCVSVALPLDCRDGARVRLTGAGDRPLCGVPAGDLVVYVQIVEGL